MLDVFGFPTPQGANYQEFYGGGTTRDWVKPRGVSMVRFMLIGAGGGGGNGTASAGGGGGGSGAVTSWIGPAIFIPDVLRVTIGAGGTSGVNATATTIVYQAKDGTGYTLLTANGGNSGTASAPGASGGTASLSNYFGAAGIFFSTDGQAGSSGGSTGAGGNQIASTTTFLSGGTGGCGANVLNNATVQPNYGYPTSPSISAGATPGSDGFFITQPILVGRGGMGGGTTTSAGGAGGIGGIGCGGGGSGEDGNAGGRGGDGAVFIWAW